MWWAVALVNNATSTVHWIVVSGTTQQVQSKYSTNIIQGPFNNRKSAQAYANQQNGPPSKKPKKGKKRPDHMPNGAAIVAQARSWLGVPYVFGGTTRQGVDCSGMVMNVAHEVGIADCPRTSEEQWAWCEHISQSDAGAGDLVFFVGAPEEAGPPGHVGIIVAPGSMIDAPFPGTVVRVDHFNMGPPNQNTSNEGNIWGYGRMRGAAKSSSANPYTATHGIVNAVGHVASEGGIMPIILFAIAVAFVVVLFLLLAGSGLLFRSRG